MRIFGSARNSKTSTNRATNVATNVAPVEEAAVMRAQRDVGDDSAERSETALARVRALEMTDEMPIVESKRAETGAPFEDGDSDVFVCRRSSPDDGDHDAQGSELAAAARAVADAELGVTLFVYGWESVEPGPLSWAFPSLRAALDAVKTMRNAVEWCIVAGGEWVSVDAARAKGAVLIEQNA
jgi:hypothetical protein